LLWTKKRLPQLDRDEISTAYIAPRLISLEYQLNQLSSENKTLEDILAKIQQHFEKQSENNEEISGPYTYAFITRNGFKKIE
jgi:hypothetical protein